MTVPGTLPTSLVAAPAPPKPVSEPAAALPRSGRLIWTGELARHQTVEIDGTHASIGALNGSLAGLPAEFHVWPAEFTRQGLVVYTTDGAERGRTEAPAKSNGWNAVSYQFDPVRAADLSIVEAPTRANGFNRLVLRSNGRTWPVIVVDWRAR